VYVNVLCGPHSLTCFACQLFAAHVGLLHVHTPLRLVLVNGLLAANLREDKV